MDKSDFFLIRPDSIKVSITNICNYNCIMCYMSSLKDAKGQMEDDLFFSLVHQCRDNGIGKISIGAVGEPLVHKRFVNFVQYAKSMGLWVSSTSNCSLLSPEISGQIFRQRLISSILMQMFPMRI